MSCALAVALAIALAGCSRQDVEDGLARMPVNMLEAACLKADNCTVYCEDGSTKSNSYPYWCQRE